MKTLLFCLIFVLGTFFPAVGQDAGQNSEILVVSQDKFLRFHGHAGRTYFIQASDPLSHLRQWLWMPVIETGNDSDISYEVGGTDPKGFFRLVYSDVPKPAGVSLEDWDLDGDGLSNWDEITLHGTYPDKPDTDGDGMTDGWEVTHDLDPQNPNDAFDDLDGDGTDNREEHDQQTDPGNQADFPTQIWSVTAAASGSSSVWTSEIKKYIRKRNWNESTYGEPEESVGHLAVGELKALVEGLTLPETLAEAKAEPDYIHYNEGGASAHGHFHQSASSSEARQGNHTVTRVWVRVPPKAEQQTLQFIKVTSRNHPDADTVVESEIVTVIVPANQTDSQFIDLKCDSIMVSGKDVITEVDLLPAEVSVAKEGEATVDGLVVKKTDTVRYRLLPGLPDEPLLLEDKIQWHWRILKWDGTYSNWTAYQDGQGHTFTAQPEDAGIYEIKAAIDGQDFFLKRKKDDLHSAKKKDENDCIGVVDEQWQINVRDHAKANLGSVAYAQGVANSNVPAGPPGGYKCNLFVGHKATDAGAIVPKINGNNPLSKYHPTANQWAGTEIKAIPGWSLLPEQTYPQPGFVVARGVAGGIGHTGIVDYDGAWISAGTSNVNRVADVRTYVPSRFRKYTP